MLDLSTEGDPIEARSVTTSWTLVTSLTILAASYASTFWSFRDLGLLRDDWAHLGQLFWNPDATPIASVLAHLSSWEWRPMRTLEGFLVLAANSLGGIPGCYLVMWPILALSGILFARLLARHWPLGLATFGGLLLALFPPDTTFLWAVMFIGRIGLLFTLLAICAFVRDRRILAGALALCALFSYELSVFPFVLAPWFKDRGRWVSVKQAAAVILAVLFIYALLRFVVISSPDMKVVSLRDSGVSEYARAYGNAFLDIFRFTSFTWPRQTIEVALHPDSRVFAAASGAIFLFGFWVLRRVWRQDARRRVQPIDLVFGSAALIAGCATAFIRPPTASIETISRANYFAAPGVALLTLGFVGISLRILGSRARLIVAVVLATLCFSAMMGFRDRVRRDYTLANQQQKALLRQIIDLAGPLPLETTLVIVNPPKVSRPSAITPILLDLNWDLHYVFSLIYAPSITALAINNPMLLEINVTALEKIGVPLPRTNIAIIDARAGTLTWVAQGPKFATEAHVAPHGPAHAFVYEDRD